MTSVLSGGVRDSINDALLEAVRKLGVDGEVPGAAARIHRRRAN